MKPAILVFASLFIASTASHAASTRNCDNGAASELLNAASFISQEASRDVMRGQDLHRRRGAERRIKRRISRGSMKNMLYVCDSALQNFRCGQGYNAFTHAFNTKNVYVCVDKMKERNFSFCDLVGTAAHEYGHIVGVKKAGDHNDGPNNDRVYKFGYAVRDLCYAQGRDRTLNW